MTTTNAKFCDHCRVSINLRTAYIELLKDSRTYHFHHSCLMKMNGSEMLGALNFRTDHFNEDKIVIQFKNQ